MILQDEPTPENPPRVPRELLEYLERIYPATAWKACATVEDLRITQGAHEVIDLLKHLYSMQTGDSHVLLETEGGATGPAA